MPLRACHLCVDPQHLTCDAWHRAVEIVCREGPARVLELAALGAEFTKTRNGGLHLTREGGHSARRVVHAADVTGREIERALLAAAAAHPGIAFYEHHAAVDLVLCEARGALGCLSRSHCCMSS